MKKITFTLLTVFLAGMINAQTLQWAKQLGNANTDLSFSVAVDTSGNVYTTGSFNDTIDLDPGPGIFNLISAGSVDVFISKLNASGNFVWGKRIGGTGDDAGLGVTVDAAGNVFITGYFSGTADFDPGVGILNLISNGSSDVFVNKLNTSGNLVWAKQMGGTSGDAGTSIAIDGSANVYTTGVFFNTADFDPGVNTFNLISQGQEDIFVSKLDAAGNFVWAKQLGGIGSNIANSIAADASGNVYTTGYFYATADFDPGGGTYNLTPPSQGYSAIFVSKLNSSGNFVWAGEFGGQSSFSQGNGIVADASGNVYTTGTFNHTVDFDPGANTFSYTSAGKSDDIFISKLDASGSFVWAKQIGGFGSDYAYSIAVDTSENIYTTGNFTGTVDFDPGTNTVNLVAADLLDVFISKLDASGNFVWAESMGGTQNDYGKSITVDASKNVYTTGYFAGTADFDPGVNTFNLTSAGSFDIFINKLSQSCTMPGGNISILTNDSICSGDTAILQANTNPVTSYQWYKGSAIIPGATSQQLSVTSSGKYKVIVSNGMECSKTLPAKTIKVVALPTAAITAQGSTTFCSGQSVLLIANTEPGLTYQWQKNTVNISGATTSSYTATQAGTYKCIITNSFGCSKTSNGIKVTINCSGLMADASAVQLYPNPANEKTVLQLIANSDNAIITITDKTGKEMEALKFSVSKNKMNSLTVPTGRLTPGFYFLKLQNGGTIQSLRLIVGR